MSKLTVSRWDASQLASAEAAWTELLLASTADPLFMSWDWQSLWWAVFSRQPYAEERGFELRLLVAHDGSGALCGIAPLYRERTRVRRILKVRRLHFIGNCWNGPGTVRTEYLDFIAPRGRESEVACAFVDHLFAEDDWDEWVLSDLERGSATHRLLTAQDVRGALVREANAFDSYLVETSDGFDTYRAGLSKSTRSKMYNRRANLERHGVVDLRPVEASGLDEAFRRLNALHEIRWDIGLYAGPRIAFHRELAARFAARDELQLSQMTVGGRLVSMLYDFGVGARRYNVQSAFDERFDRKLALGSLHLGYAVEAAFAEGAAVYDLLEGGGKKTQFKASIANARRHSSTLQVVRSAKLKAAYRLYDRVRGSKRPRDEM